MALFISAQSGNWHDPLTWDVGAVPNLGSDDVIIADGHEVVFESGYYESLGSGHLLGIAANGTLRIQGGIDAYDSTIFVMGSLIAEGNHLAIWGGANLQIDPGATVTVTSSFYLESSATAVVEGILDIASSAYADIYYDAILTIEGGGALDVYGYCYLEDGSEAVLHGDLQVDDGGTLDVAFYGLLTVELDGAAYVYGTLSIVFYGRTEVFGWLGIATTGWMYLDYQSIVNVYRDIRIGGRLVGYGGKIVMHRREGRILDFNDNLLFVLDRAYGFGQTQIA